MTRKPKHLVNRASLTNIIEVRELLTTPDPDNSRKKVLVPGNTIPLDECLDGFYKVADTVQHVSQIILDAESDRIIQGLYDEDGKRKTQQANSLGRSLKCNLRNVNGYDLVENTDLTKGFKEAYRVGELISSQVVTCARGTDTRKRKVESLIRESLYGEEPEKMTAGDKRTVRPNPSRAGKVLDFSQVNNQYQYEVSRTDTTITFNLVCYDKWVQATLLIPEHLRGADYYTAPKIVWNGNNELSIVLTAQWKAVKYKISDKHVIAIDVGLTHYVTYIVIDRETGEIVEQGRLSNYIDKELNVQERKIRDEIVDLWEKVYALETVNCFGFVHPGKQNKANELSAEIARQRSGLSKLRLNKAIYSAQELLTISVKYGNAPLVRENLSWVGNTMQNGRWNCGELFKRIQDMFEVSGGYVVYVNPAYTSKTCSHCGTLTLKDDEAPRESFYQVKGSRNMHCEKCGLIIDRDINACINIASRGYEKISERLEKQNKSKQFTQQGNVHLKYRSRVPLKVRERQSQRDKKRVDRSKNTVTPKRKDRVDKRRAHGLRVPLEMRQSVINKRVREVSYRNLCPSCYNGIRGLSRVMFSLLDDYGMVPAVSNIEFCSTNDSLVCTKFA